MKPLSFQQLRTGFVAAAAAGTLVSGATAATFTVLNTNDGGAGTLRQAIADAAASGGPDTIQFDAALDGQTITLGSELTINDATGEVTIDGRSNCVTPNGVTISGGGAVRILTVQAGSTATLRYLVLTGGNTLGSPNDDGGGIYNLGTVALVDCTIENCQAVTFGGGVANLVSSAVTLERCTVSGNTVGGGLGGGVSNNGTCTLRNSTVSGNSGGVGGGIYSQPSGGVVLVVENSTVAGNNASGFGGGIRHGFGPFRLENSIVADNTAGPSPDDIFGTVTTAAGRNLVEDPTGATGLGAGDLTGVDPQLGPLADNGGPTRTRLPGAGSAVIDAGVPTSATPPVDQRFFARQIDMGDPDGDGQVLDIGAVEVAAPGAGGQVVIGDLPPAGSPRAFGTSVTVLANGNFVITDPDANLVDPPFVPGVGAVYLYDGITLRIISTLTGSTANDHVGGGGVTALANGNFVVSSPEWDNGATIDAGAVTWGDGSAGVSGAVSDANSLVGSGPADFMFGGVHALSNGNYVVSNPAWDNGGALDAGAVTWGDGTTGVAGPVSAANSLVGSSADDGVGSSVMALGNGNYVASSPQWRNGATALAGAVTWGNGATGITGPVSVANSLVGSSALDQVGSRITVLGNGNYVVGSSNWDDGGIANVGAATWGDGAGGVVGIVSATNSLIGSTSGDQVGGPPGVICLTNGNYVVSSPFWDNSATVNAGAATWGDGTTGVVGPISAVNSLVGGSANDLVSGNSVAALANGNYVVGSSSWDNGTMVNAGAATWGDGTLGVIGVVSVMNSLVGSSAGDQVGGATALSNGNFVVRSPFWDNGAVADAGAATWGDGTTGLVDTVTAANSLVGSSASDRVGGGLTALSNGNYVVRSAFWDDGATANVGAATWGDGTVGVTGAVSAANSLVGSSANDRVGDSVTALTNGNYVVYNHFWDNGVTPDAGAATWGDGTTGVVGPVSAANSLVGSSAEDFVATRGVTALANGNYVVRSPFWDNGGAIDVGAVTWGDGTVGLNGVISDTNSLIGGTAGTEIGHFVVGLVDANYVVRSTKWDNGDITDAGAITLGDGRLGTAGIVSASNSVLGTGDGGGLSLVYEYDLPNLRIIVGDPVANRVSVHGYAPEIAVEQPVGVARLNCGTVLMGAPLGAEGSRTFTIRNTNVGELAGLFVTIDGNDAALFTVTSAPAASVGAFGSTTFTVRFAPTSPGVKTAVLRIGNNDPDEHPFDIVLSGRVLMPTEDSDGDGLNDVSEFELANFGFDWEFSQTTLVTEMFGNLEDALPNLNAEGYFTTSQVQELYIDTPLIAGDLDAGTATLTMWVEKSENLVDFFAFPMTDPQTTINGLGQLEFEFPLTNGAAFFKVGTSGD